MSHRFWLVPGLLTGSLLVHAGLVACSSALPAALTAVPENDASADLNLPASTTTPSCAEWEVASKLAPTFTHQDLDYLDLDGGKHTINLPTFAAFTLDEGWEPIGGDSYAVIARHCKKTK